MIVGLQLKHQPLNHLVELDSKPRKPFVHLSHGQLTTGINSVAFHYMSKQLTGDQSGAINFDQSELEKRVKMVIDMEDADIIVVFEALKQQF